MDEQILDNPPAKPEPLPHHISALEDLQKVHREKKGVVASAGKLFENAIFGRDSIEAAEDLLEVKPEIAKEVILILARLQGVAINQTTEEEPGRIHHEYRSLFFNDKRISAESERILRELVVRWGEREDADELLYYGSVDATPLYVRLVLDFLERHDPLILDTKYTRKDGKEATIHESVLRALSWIEKRIDTSSLGLVEFKRTNPRGIENQVWKDSKEAYTHENGEPANHDWPIAAIEVQAYAYDALMEASRIFKESNPADAQRFEEKAKTLQRKTLELFWMPDRKYFAMGIDRDKEGNPRQIKTESSNPALLLDTTIFDSLQEEERKTYINALVTNIVGPEFLTDVGIRCRALRYKDLIPFQDYHGTWAVWEKETFDIARGLRKRGFHRLASQLEVRIINGVNIAKKHYEFFYVAPDGKVNYDPESKRPTTINGRLAIFGTNLPEEPQAWTISAVLASKIHRGRKTETPVNHFSWNYKLERELLSMMKIIEPLKTIEEATKAFPQGYSFHIERVDEKKAA